MSFSCTSQHPLDIDTVAWALLGASLGFLPSRRYRNQDFFKGWMLGITVCLLYKSLQVIRNSSIRLTMNDWCEISMKVRHFLRFVPPVVIGNSERLILIHPECLNIAWTSRPTFVSQASKPKPSRLCNRSRPDVDYISAFPSWSTFWPIR